MLLNAFYILFKLEQKNNFIFVGILKIILIYILFFIVLATANTSVDIYDNLVYKTSDKHMFEEKIWDKQSMGQ